MQQRGLAAYNEPSAISHTQDTLFKERYGESQLLSYTCLNVLTLQYSFMWLMFFFHRQKVTPLITSLVFSLGVLNNQTIEKVT